MRRASVLLVLVGLLTACHWPIWSPSADTVNSTVAPLETVSKARLVVSLSAANPRTVVADLSHAASSYKLSLASANGYATKTGNATSTSPTCTIGEVEIGDWTLTATALNAAGVAIGAGSLPIAGLQIGESRTVSVPILFSRSGTGNLSFTVLFPSSSGIDYVGGGIYRYDGASPGQIGATLAPPITTDSATSTSKATFVVNGLPSAGDLSLVMSFRRGGASGSPAGTFTESVNIWDSQTSDKWIDATGALVGQRAFQAGNFLSANASLANLSLSTDGTTALPGFAFSSGNGSYAFSISPGMVYVRPTASIDGQTIKYSWDGAVLQPIASGSLSPGQSLSSGTHTLFVQVTAPDGKTQSGYSCAISVLTYNVYAFTGMWGLAFPAPPTTTAVAGFGGTFFALTRGQVATTADGVWASNGLPTPPSGTLTITNSRDTWFAATATQLYSLNGDLWQNLAALPSGVSALSLAPADGSLGALGSDGRLWQWNGLWSSLAAAPAGTTSLGSDEDGNSLYAISGTSLWLWKSGMWVPSGIPDLPQGSVGVTVRGGSLYALVVK